MVRLQVRSFEESSARGKMETASIRHAVAFVLGLGFLCTCGDALVTPPLGSGDEDRGRLAVSQDIVVSPDGPMATDCFGEFECPIEAEEITVRVGGRRVVQCIVCEPSGTVGSGDQTGETGNGGGGGGSGGSGDDEGDEFTDYTFVNCKGFSGITVVRRPNYPNPAEAIYAAETNCPEEVDDIFHTMYESFWTGPQNDSHKSALGEVPTKTFVSTGNPRSFRSQDQVFVETATDFWMFGFTTHKINFLALQLSDRSSFSTEHEVWVIPVN